jgi:hypothetical protein
MTAIQGMPYLRYRVGSLVVLLQELGFFLDEALPMYPPASELDILDQRFPISKNTTPFALKGK